jgi:hypothetical protein
MLRIKRGSVEGGGKGEHNIAEYRLGRLIVNVGREVKKTMRHEAKNGIAGAKT